MLQKISSTKARNNFSDILGQVYYGGKRFVVNKLGKPVAVIINPDEYAAIDQQARKKFFKTVDKISQKNRDIPYSQVKKDIEVAIKAVRKREVNKK